MLAQVFLFVMNIAVIVIVGGYALFLKSGHLEFGLGVLCGICLIFLWYRVTKGHWL